MDTSHSSIAVVLFMSFSIPAMADSDGTWYDAHATFYGDMSGGETMRGACGYGNLFEQGYGLETTALSMTLFNDGFTCGACFEIMCVNDPQWCIPNAGTIKVTVTNYCPPSYNVANSWCNPPQRHFDLSMPMFAKIAIPKAGIIPVRYRRIACVKSGGIKFQITGNPCWLLVLVYNVAGAGDVCNVNIRGSKTGWIRMTKKWGQNWLTGADLVRQTLSFKLTTSDRRWIQFDDVAPWNWQFNQIYEAKYNF